jgi:aminoglycoside phosphotransferase (APT) family kinase protein
MGSGGGLSQRPPWHAEHRVDAARARALIRAGCGLPADEVEPLGEGWDSAAFLVDGRWVFRFPKRADVVPHLRAEIAVLPRLTLPVAIPRFTFVVDGPPLFVGYERLPGVPLDQVPDADPAVVFADVERALAALHATPIEGPVAEVRGWDAPDPPDDLEHPVLARAAAWLAAHPAEPAPPVPCHDDLGAEHVLVDPATSRVTGLIDWGDLALGDPAIDLVGMLAWRPAAFARWYGARDPAMLRRARRLHLFHALWDCVHAARWRPFALAAQAARLERILEAATRT